MNNKPTNYSGSLSAEALLGVVFVTLKLCGIIDWPWLWVTCPFWIPLALAIGIVIGYILLPLAGAGIYMLAAGIINLLHKIRK